MVGAEGGIRGSLRRGWRHPGECGTTLVEVLAAAAATAVGIIAVAQLLSLALGANAVARHTGVAVLLAEQKLEQLRSDSAAAGSQASPPASLQQHTTGFAEYLDAAGRVVLGDPAASTDAVYERRWSIEPLHVSRGSAARFRVRVSRYVGGATGPSEPRAQYGDVVFTTIRVWSPP